MLPRFLPLLVPLLLTAGCVATGGGLAPVSARLSSEGLRVTMSDSTVCRGGPPPAGAPRWSGGFAGCPEGWRYTVALDDGTNPVRYVVEEVMTALTLEKSLAPFAEVTVIDPNAQATIFISPPSR